MNFDSEAISPCGILYAISIQYKANSKSLSEGYTDVPSTPYKTNTNTRTGEFEKWNNSAPAFGTGGCGAEWMGLMQKTRSRDCAGPRRVSARALQPRLQP